MTEKKQAPMKIEMVKISDLSFAKYNPRTISEKQIEKLTASLEKFGFVDPVVANKKNKTIVGGHQRTMCWEAMGNKEVPVFWVDLNLEDEKQLNISLNAISGSWNFEVLKQNFDMGVIEEWGFEVEKFDELKEVEELKEDEPEKEHKDVRLSIEFDTEQQKTDFESILDKNKPEGVSKGAYMLEMIYAMERVEAEKVIKK